MGLGIGVYSNVQLEEGEKKEEEGKNEKNKKKRKNKKEHISCVCIIF